jgi:TPR repeat protein
VSGLAQDKPPLPQPHYRLADYLEQTGRATRRTILAPSALWDALPEHADDRDLLRIAEEAERRSLYGHAFLLYQRAAAAGEPAAKRQIGALLGQASHIDEAVGLLQTCAEAGDRDALRLAATLLERTDRIDEAVAWLKTRGEAGEAFAFRQAARLLERSGRIDEAMGLYRRAVEAGDRDALVS